MLLMKANPLQGPLKVAGPENQDFLGPEMVTSEASAIWAQKTSTPDSPANFGRGYQIWTCQEKMSVDSKCNIFFNLFSSAFQA